MNNPAYLLSIAALLSVCALSACSGNGGEGSADIQSVSMSPTVGDSSEAAAPKYVQPTMDTLRGKPQPFPSQYPLVRYPGSKVDFAYVRPHLEPGARNQVVLTTRDEPLQVGSYYKLDMVKQGWKLIDSFENISYSGTLWRRGDEEAEVRVSENPYGQQSIQLMVGPVLKRRPNAQVVPQPNRSP